MLNRTTDGSNDNEAVKIANSFKPFVKKWFEDWGRSCVRCKKMTVTTPPNNGVIGVTDAFSDTESFIPYMSGVETAVVGDVVWCRWTYGNMQTLCAESMVTNSPSTTQYTGYVTPEMFGAIGDGTSNDYDAFSSCAEYASEHGMDIRVPTRSYYIDGGNSDSTITLSSNVYCEGSTFIVGQSHTSYYNPLFQYIHDSETALVSGTLSSFISDNYTVTSSYEDMFFVLDTGISYGTPYSSSAPSSETVKEVIISNGANTRVYFADDISSYSQRNVSATNISNIKEIGYTFRGAIIKQKNENGYGIYFMYNRRHNMLFEDIQISANNANGAGSVFTLEFCNAVTFRDIRSYSIQPSSWGYELSAYYSSNILIDNFKGYNEWSSIATRGLKNYTLKNSIATTFDCHWNAFGVFLCDNCQLSKYAHIGYGNGDFIIRNTTCPSIETRNDWFQTWRGNIIIDTCFSKSGVQIYLLQSAHDKTGYDNNYFGKIHLPNIYIYRFYSSDRILWFNINPSLNDRIYTTVLPSLMLDDVRSEYGNLWYQVPYNNPMWNAVLKNTPIAMYYSSSGNRWWRSRDYLLYGANIVSDDNEYIKNDYSNSNYISPVSSTSFASVIKRNDIVFASFDGAASQAIPSGASLFQVPSSCFPAIDVYVNAYLESSGSSYPLLLSISSSDGNVRVLSAVPNGSSIRWSTTYILANQYFDDAIENTMN